jgi:hypothetical protein
VLRSSGLRCCSRSANIAGPGQPAPTEDPWMASTETPAASLTWLLAALPYIGLSSARAGDHWPTRTPAESEPDLSMAKTPSVFAVNDLGRLRPFVPGLQ